MEKYSSDESEIISDHEKDGATPTKEAPVPLKDVPIPINVKAPSLTQVEVLRKPFSSCDKMEKRSSDESEVIPDSYEEDASMPMKEAPVPLEEDIPTPTNEKAPIVTHVKGPGKPTDEAPLFADDEKAEMPSDEIIPIPTQVEVGQLGKPSEEACMSTDKLAMPAKDIPKQTEKAPLSADEAHVPQIEVPTKIEEPFYLTKGIIQTLRPNVYHKFMLMSKFHSRKIHPVFRAHF